jgi:hypothetical protein
MAKKSKRSNRPAKTSATAAPTIPFDPSDPKIQALFKIRLKRWLCLAFIFAFLPICTVLARYNIDLLVFGLFGLFVLGHVLYRWLNQSKCPRCGAWFFMKQSREGKLTGSGLSFPPINQCQGCGQSLHG